MKSKVSDKNENPRKNANILSVLTFAYIIPTFKKGYKKHLEESDIPEHLDEHSSGTLGNRLEKQWEKQLLKKNPSLCKAILKTFRFKLLVAGIFYAINQLFIRLAQPLALWKLMKYYGTDKNVMSKNEALVYAGIIVGANFFEVLFAHNYLLCLQHLGMKLRVACCSLIFRKTLRLNISKLDGATIGQTVNLLSNDVNRCDRAALHFHTLWVCPLQAIMIILILNHILGLTSTIGIFIMIMFVPCQMLLAKKTSELRFKTAITTDKRIRRMNEIIVGIQVIKVYAWEKYFVKIVKAIRRLEIRYVRTTTFIKGVMISIQLFITKFSIFLTVLVYVLTGNHLQAEYVFVATAFYDILKQIMTKNFSSGITELAEVIVSFNRIQHFLLSDEIAAAPKATSISATKLDGLSPNEKSLNKESFAIELEQASAKWNPDSLYNDLEKIDFRIENEKCVALIGSVGSGKSTLLNVILREVFLSEGKLKVKGKLSYSSQQPWLFAGSIKQNIIFDQPMNLDRYESVVKACALDEDFAVLPFGDRTLVGERGIALSGGQKARISLARAVYKKADIYLLDDPFSAVDSQVGKRMFDECILRFLKKKCVVIVTHQLQYLQYVDKIFLIENKTISLSGTYEEFKSSSAYFADHLCDTNTDTPDSKFSVTPTKFATKMKQIEPVQTREQRSTGSISNSIYISYLKAGAPYCVFVLILFIFVVVQFFHSAADYFLALWVNYEQDIAVQTNVTAPFNLSGDSFIYIYSAIVILIIVTTLIAALSFYVTCMRASIKLHNNMLVNVVYAPMNFFNENSVGRILNRFSKDMGTIDEILPSIALDCIDVGLSILGSTIIICFVTPWMALASLVIFVIFYLIRSVYIQTSCNLKRLDGITRSPVFEHLSTTINGLTSIRAFKSQNSFQKKFDDFQDIHSSVWYLYLVCAKAFSFWLDMICVIYISLVTFSFFIYNSYDEYSGNVGLAITKALALSGRFQWGMRQWSDLENQMTSVERVVEYSQLECEKERNELEPSHDWPESGDIDFQSVSLRYSINEPYVLHNLSFHVQSNEKIGIVGRTGSGKSSIINAIFQLRDVDGNIFIDNTDISKIPLHVLRSKVCIIPQEPMLFQDTIRNNLDPFQEHMDSDLWNVLSEVELKTIVSQMPLGLETEISNGGTHFSAGQKQLLCLARALVRKSKILFLDEATANVDQQTDALIQDTIRRKFGDCTVLTVAHRLHTIMDSDKVIVMDAGSIIEFDSPRALLEDENSVFYAMVQQAGTNIPELCSKLVDNNEAGDAAKKRD